jgi:predicted DNA-binding protein
MNPPLEPRARQRRYSTRRLARLDAETHAKLQALAKIFPRRRAGSLRYVLQWGIIHGKDWTVDQSIPAAVHQVAILMAPELLQQVQDAAKAHRVSMAAWLCQAMRQVTPEDFPARWRAGEPTVRSHDSGHYGRRFMLRFADETLRKLETLTQTFQRSAAEVIRQLIAQARPEHFPQSWLLAAQERRPPCHPQR